VWRDGVTLTLDEAEVAQLQRAAAPNPRRVGPAMLVPLGTAQYTTGVLAATNPPGGEGFGPPAVQMVRGFAEQAALACEVAERRRDSEVLKLFADRDRIARNLHDLVIQRLFATGMALEGAANMGAIDPDDAVARVHRAVEDLDATIREIRTTVFALQQRGSGTRSLRALVIDVADAAANALGFAPSVRFDGLVDTAVGAHLHEHLLAVLREALSNIARHAHATAVTVEVSATDRLLLTVRDSGVGLADDGRRSGLANMAARATQLGGTFDVKPGNPGTVLLWRVPLQRDQRD
jgi:signal transduction histidine kinase